MGSGRKPLADALYKTLVNFYGPSNQYYLTLFIIKLNILPKIWFNRESRISENFPRKSKIFKNRGFKWIAWKYPLFIVIINLSHQVTILHASFRVTLQLKSVSRLSRLANIQLTKRIMVFIVYKLMYFTLYFHVAMYNYNWINLIIKKANTKCVRSLFFDYTIYILVFFIWQLFAHSFNNLTNE